MDERRCLEVLRELRSLAWTCGMDSTYLIASDEVAALDHAIATIERVAVAPVVHLLDRSDPFALDWIAMGNADNECDIRPLVGTHVRPLPDPQPDGQEG